MVTSDIPAGWKLEAVAPPYQFKLPATDKYRANYDRIFGVKDEPVAIEGVASNIDNRNVHIWTERP